MSTIKTKTYTQGRLTFSLEVQDDFCLCLVRLPKLDSIPEGGSFDQEQLCYLFRADCPPHHVLDSPHGDEHLEIVKDNCGYYTDNYIVEEYVGRQSSSDNWTPDTALDGFLDNELSLALELVEKDSELAEWLKTHYAVNKMLSSQE